MDNLIKMLTAIWLTIQIVDKLTEWMHRKR